MKNGKKILRECIIPLLLILILLSVLFYRNARRETVQRGMISGEAENSAITVRQKGTKKEGGLITEKQTIDVEIIQAICDKLGYTMELNDMEFGSIITAVASGKIDVGFGAITITEERAKSVHFTTSYSTGIQSIIVTEDSPITGVDDLKADGIKIGVQQDTTGDIYATGDFGEDHIARFNKGADAVQALLTGKCNAVIIDNSPAETFVSQNEGLKILPTVYAEEAYGFELSYDNEALYNEVNGALEELLADGTVQAIIDKYISAD